MTNHTDKLGIPTNKEIIAADIWASELTPSERLTIMQRVDIGTAKYMPAKLKKCLKLLITQIDYTVKDNILTGERRI